MPRIALALFVVLALGLAGWLGLSNGQQADQECRQRYDVATGKIAFGCEPKKAPVPQAQPPIANDWDYTQGSDLQRKACHVEAETYPAGTIHVVYCDVTLIPTDVNNCQLPPWGYNVLPQITITIKENLQHGGTWDEILAARLKNIQDSQQKAHHERLGFQGEANPTDPKPTVETLACFHDKYEQIQRADIACMRAGIVDCPR